MSEIKAPAVLQAEKKVKEIMDDIHYGTTSLTHALVRGYRNGMKKESGDTAISLILQAVKECETAYEIAVAQPEQKAAIRPMVDL
jgi:hypothetical protein